MNLEAICLETPWKTARRGSAFSDPPTVHDLEIVSYEQQIAQLDMETPLADNCLQCGGGNLRVGDYVCWGVCYGCYKQSEAEYLLHAK